MIFALLKIYFTIELETKLSNFYKSKTRKIIKNEVKSNLYILNCLYYKLFKNKSYNLQSYLLTIIIY